MILPVDSTRRLRLPLLLLTCLFGVTYFVSVSLNTIKFYESTMILSDRIYWNMFFASIYANAANSISSILLISYLVLRKMSHSKLGSLGKRLFILTASILGAFIFLLDILLCAAHLTTFPFFNEFTYMLVDIPWYGLFGTPEKVWSIVLFNLLRGFSPLLTISLLAFVLLLPNNLARRRLAHHQ